MIPEDHKTYVEVCAGAAWVFFGKEKSKYEVINDLDSEIVNFYRMLQNHLEEFVKQFRWILSSREWFEDFKKQMEATGLTDIQRAARYYYLQRQAFGGHVKKQNYGTAPGRLPKINLLRIEEELSAVHLRLAQVTIENLNWDKLLKTYDRSETFFFIDPPYSGAPVYRYNFDDSEYQAMSAALSKIKGRFLLTINDTEEMRKTFKTFKMKPVELRYTLSGKSNKVNGRELIFTNY